MSTVSEPNPLADRFARRQRTWQNVPGTVEAPPLDGHDALLEREARRTVVAEYVNPKLRGTFFPDAVFQTTIVVLVIFFVLLLITYLFAPTVGAPAEPLNQERYLPRPAWYFYFLFQLLEWMKGQFLVPIAAFWLPTIGSLALILLPFYDRNRARKITKRLAALVIFYGIILFMVVTTATNVLNAPAQPTKNDANHAPAQPQSDVPSMVINW